MIIIETERLYLQETTAQDAPFILELLNTPTYLKFIGDRGVKNLEDAKAYIAERFTAVYQRLGYGFYLTKRKVDDQPIGIFGLVKRDGLTDVDIGFALLPEFAGKGYGYEGASAVMEYAKNFLGIKRLSAITVPYNQPSIKLLEKLGMKFDRMVHIPNDEEELMLFVK